MGLRSLLGILPPRIAYPTETVPVVTLSVPPKVTLLLAEERGAELAVRPGDPVKTGQDLARKGKGSFVSPVTGQVLEIENVPGPNGERRSALSLSTEERDLFDPALVPVGDISKASPLELRILIQRLGFTNLSAVASDPAAWPPVQAVLITALDRDPAGAANQQTFRDHSDRLGACVQLLLRATEAAACVVAFPSHLAPMVANLPVAGARMVQVPPFYPNGLPEILAAKYGAGSLLRTDRGGIMGNTLVVSFEHALAMVESLTTGRPLTQKTVTLSVDGNSTLQNFRVRIGTPVGQLLEKAGVKLEPRGKLVLDGAFRGYACYSDEQPITAMTESLLVQSASAVFHFENQSCINCGRCSTICPVDLEANLIARCSEYGLFDRCRHLVAENCIECGLCAYVCPAHRPMVQLIAHAKKVIEARGLEELGVIPPPACEACGPVCPAIRLFDFEDASKEARNPPV